MLPEKNFTLALLVSYTFTKYLGLRTLRARLIYKDIYGLIMIRFSGS